jgi:hypothetical protein
MLGWDTGIWFFGGRPPLMKSGRPFILSVGAATTPYPWV